jgi:hypothetical protein
MIDIAKYADLASALFALGAAGLWIASAMVKTPKSFSVNVITVHAGDPEFPSAEVVGKGFGTSAEMNDLGKALVRQSRLSAFAAGSAAIAALLQGLLAILAHQSTN